ncbi:hypothetical protein M0R45_014688 [Rubus argutus]|uniref:Bifunctional inhibitor/plant lipid transfer protein/seed storage helical domain-containing protein n=1 Tax=Rubus argutus TaxID=59490 RepID=A0AAW1XND4_RUBAR
MALKHLFLIILASFSVLGLGFSDSMACMQKLVPCQPYFKTPEKAPATCCTPMKKMLSESSDDKNCACSIFNNPEVLKNLNITQDEALKLPKACGTNADISACNIKGTTPSPAKSPPTPSSPSNAASHFGKSGFAAIIIVLYFSAAF